MPSPQTGIPRTELPGATLPGGPTLPDSTAMPPPPDAGSGAPGPDGSPTEGSDGTSTDTPAGEADATAQAPGTGSEDGAEQRAGTTGEATGDDDGWVTSNELPTDRADFPAMPSGTGPAGADGELDSALEGLDGEILAERAVIRARANETAGTQGQMPAGAGATNGEISQAGSDTVAGGTRPAVMPGIPSARTAPPVPVATSTGPVPDDIPVAARDDDIIARQLREAAMQEPDPELREKLWDEYRRYKGI